MHRFEILMRHATASCAVHHPKKRTSRDDEKWKAKQEKQRREQAIANTTGIRVIVAIGAAVPVRLLKRDLLFIIERLVPVMDDNRVDMLARQHGIRQKRDDGGVKKSFAAFVRRVDEGTLSRLLVESSILLAASRGNPSSVLKDAATAYKVDADAIFTKVRQDFTAKEKARKQPQPATKATKSVPAGEWARTAWSVSGVARGLKVPQKPRGRLWLNDGSCVRLRPMHANLWITLRRCL